MRDDMNRHVGNFFNNAFSHIKGIFRKPLKQVPSPLAPEPPKSELTEEDVVAAERKARSQRITWHRIPKQAKQRRSGTRLADGKWQSSWDLRCLQLMGCDFDKLFELLRGKE